MMRLRKLAPALAALLTCAPASAHAQDRRAVSEPRIPPVCRSVEARIALVDGRVPDSDDAPGDTDRIQSAIDGCARGSGVELRTAGARTAFVSGPLELRPGVTLIVSTGAVLFASRNPRDYDVRPGSCGVVNKDGRGCRPLIHAAAPDTAIAGDGTIDGRGGATLTGQTVSWWDLAQQAKVERANQNVPRIVVAERADNFILYRITLRNSPNFHVMVSRTRGFTAWGVTIDAPETSRNTDGIDPSSSSDVTITRSHIRSGDDNVAIKAGANGPAEHISVVANHFYSGHGMSIGSETNGGVHAIEVRDLTIDGADNGLRIKSNPTRGGVVRDVLYQDVCIRNVKNPIVVDSFYDRVTDGALVPAYGPIHFDGVRITGGGAITIAGADREHRANLIFDGLVTDGAQPEVDASNATIAFGSGRAIPSCDGRFVPFPRK